MGFMELSRREFLRLPAVGAAILSLDNLLSAHSSKDGDLWEKAVGDEKYMQPALDAALKSSPQARNNISRFYSVYVEEREPRKSDKWTLLTYGNKQLRLHDKGAEGQFRDELVRFAKEYARIENKIPSRLQGETEKAYKGFVAEVIDLAEGNAPPADVIGVKLYDGADAYLPFRLWGREIKPLGIATKKFFEDLRYQTEEDRKSFLIDYLALAKAADFLRNPKRSELAKGNVIETGINAIFTKGTVTRGHDTWVSILANRWFNNQGKAILSGERNVSEEYLKSFSDKWRDSAEFIYLAKRHNEMVAKVEELKSRGPIRQINLNSDPMGGLWGITSLPWEGKIIPYDAAKVSKYNLDK